MQAAWDLRIQGPHHARAAVYLAPRGINLTSVEQHTRRIEAGHTPTPGPGITQTLLGAAFSADEVVDAGLTHRRLDGT